MKQFLFTFLMFCVVPAAFAQGKSAYEKHWFVKGTDTLPYRVLLPKYYDVKKEYPLIVFLHGSGERGSDNEAQLIHGWDLFLRDSIREKFPAIVVFPQCPQNSYWSNVSIQFDTLTKTRNHHFLEGGDPTTAMKLLLGLLDELEE